MLDDHSPAPRSGLRNDLLGAILFALTYFAGSELGYALSLGPSVGGTFWPPAGISLAVLLAASPRSWPWLLAAGVLANFASDALHGQVLPASIGFALANLGEPVVGALLLRRLVGGPVTLARSTELIAMGMVVVFVSAPAGAAVGAVAAQWWTDDPPGLVEGWRTWWVGDAVGALVLTPFVLRVLTGWRQIASVPASVWLEAAAFFATLYGVTDVVFEAPPTALAMPFLVFPVLLWASLRLGPIGVGAALGVVVVLTTHDTAGGRGPFAAAELSLGDRLVALQIYVGVMAISFHGLAVLWEERARTATALRLAHSGLEARHRRIVEQSPLAILAVRPDGGIQDVNPAWQRLWAPAGDAARAAGASTPWQDAALAPLITRAFGGEVVELPEREIAAAGGHRRVRGFAYPVKDDAGRVAEVVLIERDITDEVEAQQRLLEANRTLREREEALSDALRQMAEAQGHRERLLEAERFARGEAERASQLKDEFLATLSHELRTPLNAIVGWTHILRRSSSDPALTRAVDTIERNARAQTKLIDDLLDMSRIMAGKIGLSFAPVKLAEIVTAATDALRPVADAKGVTLSRATDEAPDVCVAGDATRLQQVMTNLLGNGIKFTPAGGRIEVRLGARARQAVIEVRDSGEGIPAEFLPAVFERFRQADGSFSRPHGGLGLGLSIAKQIVELHGGTIAAHSDGPNLGAVFTVTLPLVDAGAEVDATSDGHPQAVSLADLRVLVVDDEADARELLQRLLVERGCIVACAESADEALAALAARPCDVLLTDIGMPGTDGYELLRRTRAANNPVKAVAVTAFARPEDRDRALAAGFDAHLSKPISPAQLLQMLGRLANGAGRADDSDSPGRRSESVAG